MMHGTMNVKLENAVFEFKAERLHNDNRTTWPLCEGKLLCWLSSRDEKQTEMVFIIAVAFHIKDSNKAE
jgi:hypothetical protein